VENARARHAARDRAGGPRLEADDGRDFVLTSEALREDLTACTGVSEPRPYHHRRGQIVALAAKRSVDHQRDAGQAQVAVRRPARLNPAGLHEVKADSIRQREPLVTKSAEQRGGGLHVGGAGLDD